MQITIITIGSTGDVLPFTGLAARLSADGHDVTIATHAQFEELVRSRGAGFSPLPMDMTRELSSQRGQRALRTSAAGSTGNIGLYRRHWRAIGEAIVRASADSDMLLLSVMAWQGIHVAEALKIPSMGVYLQPMDPTAAFPPWTLTQRSLGGWGNRASARAVRLLGQLPFKSTTDDLRRDLGLAPIGIRRHFASLEQSRWPTVYGYSPSVLPAPTDWPEWRPVVGYWWPVADREWRPRDELTDFLAAGEPPVLITLGSMTPTDAQAQLSTIRAALAASGRRGIVQAGWAGLKPHADDGLLPVDALPHEWLLPQVSAVVHHAGAGSTAAGLRAGLPAVPLPLAADQPLWASRLVDLGVAPTSIPLRRLDRDRLTSAVVRATSEESFRVRAEHVAARLATEDGAEAVAEAISSGRYW
ncbi:glycosyltransferase [Pseudactinotalea sp.]|uniref:glycosyltransferase n=1 Tax=Pseudactinotalea sp. TaxID=1926260 RepID=UPI003B3A0AC7